MIKSLVTVSKLTLSIHCLCRLAQIILLKLFAIIFDLLYDFIRRIALKVRSAVAGESATELCNCNNLCSSGKHSLKQSLEHISLQIASIFFNLLIGMPDSLLCNFLYVGSS